MTDDKASLFQFLDAARAAFALRWSASGFMHEPPEVIDIVEQHIIIDNGGVYYAVPYHLDADNKVIVSTLNMWAQVERGESWAIPSLMQPIEAERSIDLMAFGAPIKALGEGKTGGYLVRFSNADDPDLEGDFFTKATDYGIEGDTVSLVYYQHGKDGVLKKKRMANRANIGMDDVGVWIEHQLDLREKYEAAIYGMVEANKLGWSSGTAGHLVDRQPVGKARWISNWPLGIDATYTPTPADYKNLITVKSWLESAESDELDANASNEAAPPAINVVITDNQSILETNIMEMENERIDQLEGSVNEMSKAFTLLVEKLSNTSQARGVTIAPDSTTDHPEVKSFGDFLIALARGNHKRLSQVYKSSKDMTEGTGTQGGYLVPSEYGDRVLQMMSEQSQVLARVNRVSISAPSGEYPVLDQFAAPTVGSGNTAFAAGLTSAIAPENTTYTETQATFETLQWRLNKVGGYVEVTNELLEDSAFSVETLLRQLFAIAVQAKHERNILRGSGAGEPLGILSSSAAVAVTVDTNNTFVYADALEMITRFKSFGGNPVWIIHPSVWAEIGSFAVGTTGTSFMANLQTSPGSPLLGYPVIMSEHMPGLIGGTGYDRVLLADLSAYLWFEKRQLEIAFSEHVGFTKGVGTFRFDHRVDGKPWLRNAITLANPDAAYTVSPFVYLDD